MKIASILIVLGALVIAGLGIAFLFACEDDWCFLFDWQKVRAADSFERCAALGFPVAESYPRQCQAGDKLFVEEVGSPLETAQIRVIVPVSGERIESPLLVSGQARGPWYFEASFPVRLFDGNGRELAVEPAQAQGEWMTIEFVPFTVILNFSAPATETGTLILEKDNPSGLPEHADSVSIPIRF
ncbi:MAG: Gmad2 immunoglobulin-like domain-containing protein [bacterium]|nr:Gmad2 immunoglobulin-like domain-containing protein [bacterium]MDZ4296453.1 Gmad2 immunoglobulin-like domain-containing protein [Patescibacteria group bacterium]